jgi:hypothetical protein
MTIVIDNRRVHISNIDGVNEDIVLESRRKEVEEYASK